MKELMTRLSELHKDPNWRICEMKLHNELDRNGIHIELTNHSNLGRCYYSDTFHITSKQELSNEFISFLREIGLLGYGQEFWFEKLNRNDGKFVIVVQSRIDSSD